MVVVAIIGLLSAVAIPNFKKYQAKAKMSEAKLQLSALYTAQTAFFSDYNIYHNCLTYMGFDPGPEAANRYYAIGIDATAAINGTAYTAAVNSGLNTTDCASNNASFAGGVNTVSQNKATYFVAGKGIGSTIANSNTYLAGTAIGSQADTSTMVFTAAAGGVISQDFTTTSNASLMSINERKILSVVRNGF